jgi:hypothetical protein
MSILITITETAFGAFGAGVTFGAVCLGPKIGIWRAAAPAAPPTPQPTPITVLTVAPTTPPLAAVHRPPLPPASAAQALNALPQPYERSVVR